MDINASFADINLKSCFVEKIDICNDFSNISKENLTISLDVKNGVSDTVKNEQTNCLEANLILDLTVNAVSNSDDTKKYRLNIVLNGLFTYKGTDEIAFYNMLLLNGNSTLYSIARANVITLTAMSSTSGQIVLPMINFVKLIEKSIQAQDNQQ